MSIDVEKQAAEANWVRDVKMLVEKLNESLGKVPEGVDVSVDASKGIHLVGAIDLSTAKESWRIELKATKTQTLIG
ncbi:hypothetical protein LMG22037_04683 [Paraburkholderia phenoliruptrix]|uniref:Uncharacterized protein n=1 Tax=Paraburkholderia phenoliruptrix TaxID=252970 RepID=A0A6J5BZ14_9BURK|nr:hypothetical protein [Paraburkholderia phenoliruptrix]CAB3720021.1 hypothetical protein LMG22037_04683 [Paraburkholderia phenoliruptrix]